MKRNLLSLIAVMALPVVLMAQSVDDDMYFVPSKKKAAVKSTTLSSANSSTYSPVRSADDSA